MAKAFTPAGFSGFNDPFEKENKRPAGTPDPDRTNIFDLLKLLWTPVWNPVHKAIYEDERGLRDILSNIWEGVRDPKGAKTPNDVAYSIPDNIVDKPLELLWGKDWKEGLAPDQIDNTRDVVKKSLGFWGMNLGSIPNLTKGLTLAGQTKSGLTSHKIQSIAPALDNAKNKQQFTDILVKNNISPSSEIGKQALKMYDDGIPVTDTGKLADAFATGKKAPIVVGKGKHGIHLPGEQKVAGLYDDVADKVKSTELVQKISAVHPDISPALKQKWLGGARQTNKMVDDMDDVVKTFKNKIETLSNKSNFTTSELFDLAEYKKLPATFNGKTVPTSLKSSLDDLREPLIKAQDDLLKTAGVDFNAIKSDKLNYIPRETSDDALKAMKENVPEWYNKFYLKDIDKGFDSTMFNPTLKTRAFADMSRAEINRLSNMGKLGIVGDTKGGMIAVGNIDDLKATYPQFDEMNLIKNLTGGKKVDFYVTDPIETITKTLKSNAKTLGAKNSYENLIRQGLETGEIKPLRRTNSFEGLVNQKKIDGTFDTIKKINKGDVQISTDPGYVPINPSEAGDLYPLFADYQMTPAVRDQIKGIMESTPKSKDFAGLKDAYKTVINNFKKMAIGANPSYQLRNLSGNIFRGFTDPTKDFATFSQGLGDGITTSLGTTKAGKAIGLDKFGDRAVMLPTGEITSPNALSQEMINTGGLSSGFKGGVIKSNTDDIQDILREFLARKESGQNIATNVAKTGKDAVNKGVDLLSQLGIKSRSGVEHATRSGDYIANRMAGYLPADAQGQQFTNMIDYQNFGKTVDMIEDYMPFAKYQIATKPLFAERFIKQPHKFALPTAIQDYVEVFGTDEADPEEVSELMREYPPPDYMKAPVFSGIDEEGLPQYVDTNRLMGGAMDYMPDPVKIGTSGDINRELYNMIFNETATPTNPVLKTLYELGSDKDMFTKRDIPELDFIGNTPVDGKVGKTIRNFFPPTNVLDDIVDENTSFMEMFLPVEPRTSYELPVADQDLKENKEIYDNLRWQGKIEDNDTRRQKIIEEMDKLAGDEPSFIEKTINSIKNFFTTDDEEKEEFISPFDNEEKFISPFEKEKKKEEFISPF